MWILNTTKMLIVIKVIEIKYSNNCADSSHFETVTRLKLLETFSRVCVMNIIGASAMIFDSNFILQHSLTFCLSVALIKLST